MPRASMFTNIIFANISDNTKIYWQNNFFGTYIQNKYFRGTYFFLKGSSFDMFFLPHFTFWGGYPLPRSRCRLHVYPLNPLSITRRAASEACTSVLIFLPMWSSEWDLHKTRISNQPPLHGQTARPHCAHPSASRSSRQQSTVSPVRFVRHNTITSARRDPLLQYSFDQNNFLWSDKNCPTDHQP